MLDACAAIFRALLYGGALSCVGVVFAARSLPLPELSRLGTQIVRRGAWLVIAASLAGTLVLLLRLGGQFDEPTLAAVLNSGFGAATAMQLAGAGLLLASLDDPTAHSIRLANATLITLSFAASGHAPAADLANGLLAFVHASTAAWWVGSLWLLRFACNNADLAVTVNAVRRFSARAVIVVGVLVLAGIMLIRVLLNFDNLPQLSSYETTLILKIAIVVTVLGLATYNKLRLTPRLLDGDAKAAAVLRKSINVELALIGAVIAVTAILTTYTAPPE